MASKGSKTDLEKAGKFVEVEILKKLGKESEHLNKLENI